MAYLLDKDGNLVSGITKEETTKRTSNVSFAQGLATFSTGLVQIGCGIIMMIIFGPFILIALSMLFS